MFSFFETDRLYLRPFFFSDSQDFHEIASNPENLQFIFPSQASPEESQYALANYFMKAPLGVWAICDKKTEKMIGSIKFEKLDDCLLYTSPSPRDLSTSRMPSSA